MQRFIVGLISDTHGLLRPQALALLRGSDFIIHAGDVGDPGIIDALAALAPVTAVRGNIDTGDWLAETATLTIGPIMIHVVHRIEDLGPASGFDAVITGHSHKPGQHLKDGVLYVNPGSAGPRRFSLPISLGRLIVEGTTLSAEVIEIPHPVK
jgi:putative phosphoesterase